MMEMAKSRVSNPGDNEADDDFEDSLRTVKKNWLRMRWSSARRFQKTLLWHLSTIYSAIVREIKAKGNASRPRKMDKGLFEIAK